MASRVVTTGLDADGRSVFTSDRLVKARTIGVPPLISVSNLAAAENFAGAGAEVPDADRSFFPGAGALRVTMLEWAPLEDRPAMSPATYVRERDKVLVGYAEDTASADDGLHSTKTIDFGWVIEGELTLELADGLTTTLRAGDSVIQNATAHRWSNRTAYPCRAIFAMVGLQASAEIEG